MADFVVGEPHLLRREHCILVCRDATSITWKKLLPRSIMESQRNRASVNRISLRS